MKFKNEKKETCLCTAKKKCPRCKWVASLTPTEQIRVNRGAF